MSKNLDVPIWIEYRVFYGKALLKEAFGGNFVIVNEHLQDKFDKFIKKVNSYINSAIEWLKLFNYFNCGADHQIVHNNTVHLLGTKYYLMSAFDLDSLCEWVKCQKKCMQ